MLGNLTSYLTEKDWEEITKRIEACVERVLARHGFIKGVLIEKPCIYSEKPTVGYMAYCETCKKRHVVT